MATVLDSGLPPMSVTDPPDPMELIENDDGSVTVIEPVPPAAAVIDDFYSDLSAALDQNQRNAIATDLIELIERDIEARSKRDEQYEEGIKRSGLGKDAPGGGTHETASRTVHPLITECAIDFAARINREIMPPDGMVKYKIRGKPTAERQAKARRKTDHMNWQLLIDSPQFRAEVEKLTSQLPLGGSQYLKIWYDTDRDAFDFEFVPIDKVVVPYSARSFWAAPRITEICDLTEDEVEDRMASGMYRKVVLDGASTIPQPSKAEEASNKVEGKEDVGVNQDGIRRLYVVSVRYKLPAGLDKLARRDRLVPYLIVLDEMTDEVLSVRRNWEEGDKGFTRIDWLHEFSFLPWRGAYGMGLPQAIGGLSAAATGALRALLDSAHVNNFPTALKLKSAQSGTTVRLLHTGLHEIDGMGTDDIRKTVMPLPFNPPSEMLFKLLAWLSDAGRGVVRTTLEDMAEDNTTVPVGTQLSRVEQGLVVYSSIFGRVHSSMGRVFQTMHRLNRMYLPDTVEYDAGEESETDGYLGRVAHRSDYEGPCDMVPVSDPRIFTEQQRIAQLQGVRAIHMATPGEIDPTELVRRELSTLRVPDIDALLTKKPRIRMINQAAENVAMSLGQPVAAFPQQDHLAHLQVLVNFLVDPMLGANQIIAPTFLPASLTHIKEHILLWYVEHLDNLAQEAAGFDPTDMLDPSDPGLVKALDGLLAAASNLAHDDVQYVFSKLPPIIDRAMKIVHQLQESKPLGDPAADVALRDVKRREERDQGDLQLRNQQIKTTEKVNTLKLITAAGADKRDDALEELKIKTEAMSDDLDRLNERLINREDNETVKTVARIKASERAAVPGGLSTNPKPGL